MNTRMIVSLAAVTLFAATGLASAQSNISTLNPGPRDQQVNAHAANVDSNINNAAQSGAINATQAAKDNATVNSIDAKTNAEAANQNGHLTKAQQASADKKLRKQNRRVAKQEKKDAAAAGTPSTTSR